MGLDDLIVPIHADATDLPFAEEFFDAIISVDAYYYFGREASFMDSKLAPFAKVGAQIALAFPDFKKDIHDALPPLFLLSWRAEDLETFHDCQWWQALLKQSQKIELQSISEMACCKECWDDWLNSNIDYAVNDRKSMAAGAGDYMNMIAVLAKRI